MPKSPITPIGENRDANRLTIVVTAASVSGTVNVAQSLPHRRHNRLAGDSLLAIVRYRLNRIVHRKADDDDRHHRSE